MKGFKITRGDANYEGDNKAHGGGALIKNKAEPTIKNCLFANNVAGGSFSLDNSNGGAIYCRDNTAVAPYNDAHVYILNNNFIDNIACYSYIGNGGAISAYKLQVTINNNNFQNNKANSNHVGYGGAIYCLFGSGHIENNIIDNNQAAAGWGDGGGIYVWHFEIYIKNNVITNNVAGNSVECYGGGISCDEHSGGSITNNTISGNIAAINTRGVGGGIYIANNCWFTIKSNLIKSNIAVTAGFDGNNECRGGGICAASNIDIFNNLIIGNITSTSTENNQAGCGGGVFAGGTCNIYNNTFYANANITSANGTGGGSGICPGTSVLKNNLFVNHNVANSDGVAIKDGYPTVCNNGFYNNTINVSSNTSCTNCVEGDPMFTDATNDDFSLMPGSVCVNEGDPTTDITSFPLDYAGNPRIHYGIIDIGAYEYFGPFIDQDPQNTTVCAGDNSGFSITAMGVTSYQWQVNTGSGFANISNGGVYNDATTNSLIISGALQSMNNYVYRCVATTAPMSDTSNSAILYVNPAYNLATTVEVCSGDSYTFPDGTTHTNITAQVVHTSNLLTALGCDSIIVTTVDVNPVYNINENVRVCSGDDYTFPDGTIQTNITAQVVYTSNLQTTLGCDSIIETTVDVNPVYNLSENDTVCSGDSYTFPDGTIQTNITAQVVYTSNLQTTLGCDSIIETTLEVNPVYNIFENVSVCSGDDYTFPDGTTQTNIIAPVVYTSYLLTTLGCDSIIETSVGVNPVYNIFESVSVCSGDDYTFPDGTTQTNITAPVVYTSYLLTTLGCDSIIETSIGVNPVYYLYENDTICSGDDYTFPDGTTQTNITTPMVYTSYLLTTLGCDSIIETSISVNPVYFIPESDTICSGDDYTFPDGTTQTNITTQVVYSSYFLTILGCDSIIETTIYVNPNYYLYENDSVCSGDDYTFPDGTTQTNIISQVVYTSYLLTTLGCDSIIETTVDIHIVDVSVTVNEDTLTSNAMGAIYQWIDCNNNYLPIQGAINQSFIPTVTGDYAVIVDDGMCADTSICYYVLITGISVIQNSCVKVFPNPTTGKTIIEGINIKMIELLTFQGQVFKQIQVVKDQMQIDLSSQPPGVCFVKIITDQGVTIKKVVVIK